MVLSGGFSSSSPCVSIGGFGLPGVGTGIGVMVVINASNSVRVMNCFKFFFIGILLEFGIYIFLHIGAEFMLYCICIKHHDIIGTFIMKKCSNYVMVEWKNNVI